MRFVCCVGVVVGDMGSFVDLVLLDEEDVVFLGWCFLFDLFVFWNFFDKLEKYEWVFMRIVMMEVNICCNSWKVVVL